MLVTNHVLSGAAVGALVRHPIPAFALGIASHFVLDSIPHWGQWGDDKRFFKVAVADGLTGLATMAAMTKLAADTGPRNLPVSVLAGMAGAALPDLDKPSKMLLNHTLWPEAVNRLHHRIQDEAPHRFFSHEVVGAVSFALSAVALIRRVAR
jgi:hypothetical protein